MTELDKITKRLDELIAMGESLLRTQYESNSFYWVQQDLFSEWRAGALSFLVAVFGKDSTHFAELTSRCMVNRHSMAIEGQGILKAAKADLDGGYLKKIEDLVSADVFSDFLEMAGYLLEQGYKDPAASLIGAVLEDGLRRMARARNITVNSHDSISSLNKRLSEVSVYNRMVQRQVDVWNELRNNADHGHFDQYQGADVKRMLDGVRSFLAQHL